MNNFYSRRENVPLLLSIKKLGSLSIFLLFLWIIVVLPCFCRPTEELSSAQNDLRFNEVFD